MSYRTRFVFFDLGNVLVRFSIDRLLQQVADVAQCSPSDVKLAYFEEGGVQHRFEKGEMTLDEYFDKICERLGHQPDRKQLLHAINDIFWLNDEVLPFVSALEQINFPRGILSNVGPEHWGYCQKTYPMILEKFPFNHILSYQVHELKPKPGIYEAAIRMAQNAVPGICPHEILFIDDLLTNVQGAIDCGLDAVQYTTAHALYHDFQERGLPHLID